MATIKTMQPKSISIAGANTLLGQHLLERLLEKSTLHIASLHDRLAEQGASSIIDSSEWAVDPKTARQLRDVPLLTPAAEALAPILVSFLPEDGAKEIEAKHLARGTRVVTHCEHARLNVPLAFPNVLPDPDPATQYLATPNCTTAICALPLYHIHRAHTIEAATITTLQAVSGADLPGIHAYMIHDRVIGHLDGEANALTQELNRIFDSAFAIDVFATRVPVWRGHTITVSLHLKKENNCLAVEKTLRSVPGIHVESLDTKINRARDRFTSNMPLATVGALRDGANNVLMVLKGDNLNAATVGLMEQVLERLEI